MKIIVTGVYLVVNVYNVIFCFVPFLLGSINNTGSVVAAASFLGGVEFVEVAATVKIIQNAIMGFIAVGVALYWAKYEENPKSEWRKELVRFYKSI